MTLGREQHAPDSSNHSLYLMKLLSSTYPEVNCEGTNDLHFLLIHICRYTYTYIYTCTYTHIQIQIQIHIQVQIQIHIHIHIHLQEHIRSHIYLKKFSYMSSCIVTDTTTFEFEFCGHKQAIAQAHVRPHCLWLNFEHTKNSNRSKI